MPEGQVYSRCLLCSVEVMDLLKSRLFRIMESVRTHSIAVITGYAVCVLRYIVERSLIQFPNKGHTQYVAFYILVFIGDMSFTSCDVTEIYIS
jgi:hypothetical protein